MTLETNPNKFLDTQIIHTDERIKIQVYNNAKNLWSAHWSLKSPMSKYKRNVTIGVIHRTKKIASDFSLEKKNNKNQICSSWSSTKYYWKHYE